MTDRRRRRLEEFDSAPALDERERRKFLDASCGPDSALCAAVDGLLAGASPETRFMETRFMETRQSSVSLETKQGALR